MSAAGHTVLVLAALAIVGGLSALAYQLAKLPPVARPTLGARGLNRARALRRGLVFPWAEPLIRSGAAWVALWPIAAVRRRARVTVMHAGDYLGLSGDELIAACLLGGAALGGAALLICNLLSVHGLFALIGLGLGFFVPWFRVTAVAQLRARTVGLSLIHISEPTRPPLLSRMPSSA